MGEQRGESGVQLADLGGFLGTAVQDEDAATVALALEMPRPAVYVAKCRCIARIREKISSAASERW